MKRLLQVPTPDDPGARGRALTAYGGVVYWQGDYLLAQATYEEALVLYRDAGDEAHEALALFDLGFTMSVNRDTEGAARTLAQAEQLYARLGDERGRLMVVEGRAAVALIARDLELARDIAEGAVEDYRRLDMRYRLVDTMGMLIGIYLELGDIQRARLRWAEWTQVWLAIGDMSVLALVFEYSARLALEDGRPIDAAKALGGLQQIRDRNEPFLLPGAVMGLRDPEQDARSALAADDYEAAFAEGRAWPRDAAINEAIRLGLAGDSAAGR